MKRICFSTCIIWLVLLNANCINKNKTDENTSIQKVPDMAEASHKHLSNYEDSLIYKSV